MSVNNMVTVPTGGGCAVLTEGLEHVGRPNCYLEPGEQKGEQCLLDAWTVGDLTWRPLKARCACAAGVDRNVAPGRWMEA